MDQSTVIISKASSAIYPSIPPFHASRRYPENNFDVNRQEPNLVYEAVRECFRLAGLDSDNFNTPHWNPLKNLINPGETVLLKPNFVKESHPRYPDGWKYVITHGSVIRVVADYVFKALCGKGKVIVADAPQTDSSFNAISSLTSLDTLVNFYRSLGLDFQVIDLRKEEWTNKNGVITDRKTLPGDPLGYTKVDLGEASEFYGHGGSGRYYGADYATDEVNKHHCGSRQEYMIAATVLSADAIFSLPKLKTHKKAGVTVTLKNLVGVNGDKNWLPHYTTGEPRVGGDERPHLSSKGLIERKLVSLMQYLSLKIPSVGPFIYRCLRGAGFGVFGGNENVVRSGNWWGNDTTWRMCLDLNKIATYGLPDGSLVENDHGRLRRHYSLVDGIIAGEGNGPMDPNPVPAG